MDIVFMFTKIIQIQQIFSMFLIIFERFFLIYTIPYLLSLNSFSIIYYNGLNRKYIGSSQKLELKLKCS